MLQAPPTSHQGAGVLPFCVHRGQVHFLMQRTLQGRKQGYLIDFGGAVETGESRSEAALREFVEETWGLFLGAARPIETCGKSALDPSEKLRQIGILEGYMTKMKKGKRKGKSKYEHCVLKRDKKGKDWRTYVLGPFPWVDLEPINHAMAEGASSSSGLSKQRVFVWVSAPELMSRLNEEPYTLWKRVRQLKGLRDAIRAISKSETGTKVPKGKPQPFVKETDKDRLQIVPVRNVSEVEHTGGPEWSYARSQWPHLRCLTIQGGLGSFSFKLPHKRLPRSLVIAFLPWPKIMLEGLVLDKPNGSVVELLLPNSKGRDLVEVLFRSQIMYLLFTEDGLKEIVDGATLRIIDVYR